MSLCSAGASSLVTAHSYVFERSVADMMSSSGEDCESPRETALLDVDRSVNGSMAEMGKLMDGLTEDRTIETLLIAGNELGTIGARRQLPGYAQPVPPAITPLAHMFEANPTLTAVDLSDNALGLVGQQGVVRLMKALLETRRVRRLDLSGNPLCGPSRTRYDGLIAVAEWARDGGCEWLRLRRCDLHADCALIVAKALDPPSRVTFLDVAENALGHQRDGEPTERGVAAIAMRVAASPPLRSLSLAANGLDNDAGKVLAPAVAQSTHLRQLNLGANDLGDTTELASVLRFNETLQWLDLSDCLLSNHALETLASALVSNTGLRTLRLSGNRTESEHGTKPLLDALRRNITLWAVDISGCGSESDDTKVGLLTRANFELKHLAENPLKYWPLDEAAGEVGSAGKPLMNEILRKLPRLPLPTVQKLYTNKRVFGYGARWQDEIQRLCPPSRKRTVAGTLGVSPVQEYAARAIQRKYRAYRGRKAMRRAMRRSMALVKMKGRDKGAALQKAKTGALSLGRLRE